MSVPPDAHAPEECPNCGHQVIDGSLTCPNCGRSVPTKSQGTPGTAGPRQGFDDGLGCPLGVGLLILGWIVAFFIAAASWSPGETSVPEPSHLTLAPLASLVLIAPVYVFLHMKKSPRARLVGITLVVGSILCLGILLTCNSWILPGGH